MLTSTNVSLPGGDMVITACAASDTGSVRTLNEDSFIAASPLFVVADGMGGHAHGDAASQAAVAAMIECLPESGLPTPAHIIAAISAANDSVITLSRASGVGVSGSTLAGVALVQDVGAAAAHWMAFNVGDSRIYRWDGRTLTQLTVDHSAVQELIDAGLLTADAAHDHPDRNVITRAIGAREDVEADVWLLPLAASQTFLVCSDGLTKELGDDAIALALTRFGAKDTSGTDTDAKETVADTLVAEALAVGGRDNVTVVVVESALEVAVESESTRDRTGVRSDILEDTTPRA